MVYVNSSDPSSPVSSAASSPKRKHSHASQRNMAPIDGINEDERVLVANRRRLLAQKDWLELAPTQPLKRKYRSSSEKDRIGRRRKIEKHGSRRNIPAGHRADTPLFDQKLLFQDHMMSGALPPDDFQVKIGTDALATQTQATQPSRRSNTSGKTSMRHPSTEFESLSEEPMLLGENGDSFDRFPLSYETNEPWQPVNHPAQYAREVPNMDMRQHWPGGEVEVDESLDVQPSDGSINFAETRQDTHIQMHDDVMGTGSGDYERAQNLNSPPRGYDYLTGLASHFKNETILWPPLHPGRDGGKAVTVSSENDIEDDEDMWKRFMNVMHHVSSNPSTAAVKSSSNHTTSSESNPRPALVEQLGLHSEDHPSISTPRGVGTQNSMAQDDVRANDADHTTIPTSKLPSPSTSLQQITRLAEQPSTHREKDPQAEEEEALWRQFVCGSQTSSDESSPQQDRTLGNASDVGNALSLVSATSSGIVSGLGTSNQTTNGEDTAIIADSMSMKGSRATTTSPQKSSASSDKLD